MAECDKTSLSEYVNNLHKMRAMGRQATTYFGLFKMMSKKLNVETWHQMEVRWCWVCPCPEGKDCDPKDIGKECCWVPCQTESFDTGLIADSMIVNPPNFPPFPGGPLPGKGPWNLGKAYAEVEAKATGIGSPVDP